MVNGIYLYIHTYIHTYMGVCLSLLICMHLIFALAQSAGAVEYTDCTSAEG